MPRDLVATPSQTVGPFFHFGLTTMAELGHMAGADTPGQRIRLRVRVTDGAGDPVPDAIVELWQADAMGRYPQPADVAPGVPAHSYPSWGRLPTGTDGWCEFSTILPGSVTGTDGRPQGPHINACLFMRGLLRHVYTRIYFDGDALLGADPVLLAVPAERRSTLIAKRSAADVWQFEIRMQGPDETVFLDI
jgi:protocatechuate 3,4-dioxygenase alpha subunit